MVTQIGVILLLASAAPGTAPTRLVVVPLAADPALQHARLTRHAPMFHAPALPPDLRPFDADAPVRLVRSTPRPESYAVDGSPDAEDAPRTDDLLASDRGRLLTGYRARRSTMAAGLSLRMTAPAGVLESEVGMSGAVGRALTRVALEAVAPE